MHRSLSHIEIPSRNLAKTKLFLCSLGGRSSITAWITPRLMTAEWLAASSPSGPINNECRSCSAVACAVVADYHMRRD
jgi:hypothetical protein